MEAQAEREAAARGRAGNAAPNASNAHGRECRLPLPGGKSVPGAAWEGRLFSSACGREGGAEGEGVCPGKILPCMQESRFLSGESLLALHAGGEQFLHRGAKRVGLRLRIGGVLALYGEVCLELGLGARRPDD